MSLIDKAKKLANEHPDMVHKALDKAEQLADEKTGHQYTEQIHSVADRAAHGLTDDQPKPPLPAA